MYLTEHIYIYVASPVTTTHFGKTKYFFLRFWQNFFFFYIFDETFLFGQFFFYLAKLHLVKLHLANFIWQNFIWRTSYGVDWLRQSIPWLCQVPVVLIFSNGWTDTQTNTHLLNYIIDNLVIKFDVSRPNTTNNCR